MRRPPRPRICSSPCGRRATTPSVSRWRASSSGSTLPGRHVRPLVTTWRHARSWVPDGVPTLQGLGWLGEDDGTRVIVIVSKPSSRDVADRVLAAAARIGKPAVACLLGYDGQIPTGLEVVTTLEEAAIAAVRLTGAAPRGLDLPVITSSATSGR